MDLQETLLSPKKTFWKERNRKPVSFFCPVCKIQRKITLQPQPQAVHYFQVFLAAVVFTLLTWSIFSWKGIVSFLPIWTAFEIIYRAKVRAALYCEDCGFDPFLFMVNQEKARKEIQNHWQKKFREKGLIPGEPPPLVSATEEPPTATKPEA